MSERSRRGRPTGPLRHHPTMVDWSLVGQIAAFVAGEGTNGASTAVRLDGLPAAAAESERLGSAHTRLRAPRSLPPPEALSPRGRGAGHGPGPRPPHAAPPEDRAP